MGMSQAEYARHRKAQGLSGGTAAAVTYAVQSGRIAKLPDGTIDPAEADAMWAANTASTAPTPQTAAARKPTPAKATDKADFNDERAAHERAKRQRTELELAVRKGELLEAPAVRSAVFEGFRSARDRLRAIPAQVAGALAAESDPAKCAGLVGRAIDEALGDVAKLAAVAPEVG